MSGRPNAEGIRLLRSAVERYTNAHDRIEVLKAHIEKGTKELKDQTSELVLSRNIIFDYMNKMDVASSGNAGWQERMLVFLSVFQQQDFNSRLFDKSKNIEGWVSADINGEPYIRDGKLVGTPTIVPVREYFES